MDSKKINAYLNSHLNMHFVIVIAGVNAAGKSSLAVELATKYNGEVISADSRQVYTGLDIGTGKITKSEMGGIPHHLIDIVDPTKTYTAADFARDGQQALKEIQSRGKVPIIAGGSGFYIDALIQPDILPFVPPNEELRTKLENKNTEDLFAELKKLDPERAAVLESKGEENLKRRIIRSIEIASSPSNIKGTPLHKGVPLIKVLWIGLDWDTEKLKKRIKVRTQQRLDSGMIEEAKKLHAEGLPYERMTELGLEYKHLALYLQGEIDKAELVARIERDDWHYAKRQRTWFKRNPDIHWFYNGETEGVNTLVKEFLK